MANYPYVGYQTPGYQPPGYQTPGYQTPFNSPTIPSQAQNFVCRPVASREEVLSFPADFMGSPQFFPDIAHGVIYMKRLNSQTGSADIFEFKTERQQEAPQIAFAPMQDLMDLRDAVENLKGEVDKLKKPQRMVKKNDASDE